MHGAEFRFGCERKISELFHVRAISSAHWLLKVQGWTTRKQRTVQYTLRYLSRVSIIRFIHSFIPAYIIKTKSIYMKSYYVDILFALLVYYDFCYYSYLHRNLRGVRTLFKHLQKCCNIFIRITCFYGFYLYKSLFNENY